MANGPKTIADTNAVTLASAVRAVRKTRESPAVCSSICRSIGANQLTSQTSMAVCPRVVAGEIGVAHSLTSPACDSTVDFQLSAFLVYPRAPRYALGARSVGSAAKRTLGVIDPEITCSNCLIASARPKPNSTSDPRKPYVHNRTSKLCAGPRAGARGNVLLNVRERDELFDDAFHPHRTRAFDQHDVARLEPAVEDRGHHVEFVALGQLFGWHARLTSAGEQVGGVTADGNQPVEAELRRTRPDGGVPVGRFGSQLEHVGQDQNSASVIVQSVIVPVGEQATGRLGRGRVGVVAVVNQCPRSALFHDAT